MKRFVILAAVFITGVVSVLLVQRFYSGFYEKWRFFTLREDSQAPGADAPWR